MRLRHVAIGVLAGVAGLGFIAVAAARAEDPPRPDQLVDALNGVFGKHPGDRAAHTKGICLTGQFTPAARRALPVQGAAIRQARPDHRKVLLGRRQPAGG